jgi:carbon-monoxide dehydrogenase large subunit
MEASAQDVVFADGAFRVSGTDLRRDLFEVAEAARDPAKLPAGMEPGLDATHHRVPQAQTFPNGCHIVEVEIDPETCLVTIDRYTVVDDFGRTINPLLLEGQVHGGTVQGIGQAVLEHAVYDSRIWRARSATRTEIRLASLQDIPATLFNLDTDPAFRLRCTSPLRKFHHNTTPCASGPMRTDRAALEQADWLLPESRACHWGTVISSST